MTYVIYDQVVKNHGGVHTAKNCRDVRHRGHQWIDAYGMLTHTHLAVDVTRWGPVKILLAAAYLRRRRSSETWSESVIRPTCCPVHCQSFQQIRLDVSWRRLSPAGWPVVAQPLWVSQVSHCPFQKFRLGVRHRHPNFSLPYDFGSLA